MRLRFRLERFVELGPFYRIAGLWVLLLLLAGLGGAVAWLAYAAEFEGPREAAWWAFLHLTDTGRLAEDRAPGTRILGVVLSIAGLAVFVGALIAVLTQWFEAHMEHLSLGLTPVTYEGHFVVLGWTSRMPELVAALLGERAGARVVLMTEEITPQVRQDVLDRLERRRLPRRLVFRTGDPEQVEHLARARCNAADAIAVPGRTGVAESASDARALKIVASLERHTIADGRERPRVAVELFDPALVPVAEASYAGPLLAVPGDLVLGRSLCANQG